MSNVSELDKDEEQLFNILKTSTHPFGSRINPTLANSAYFEICKIASKNHFNKDIVYENFKIVLKSDEFLLNDLQIDDKNLSQPSQTFDKLRKPSKSILRNGIGGRYIADNQHANAKKNGWGAWIEAISNDNSQLSFTLMDVKENNCCFSFNKDNKIDIKNGDMNLLSNGFITSNDDCLASEWIIFTTIKSNLTSEHRDRNHDLKATYLPSLFKNAFKIHILAKTLNETANVLLLQELKPLLGPSCNSCKSGQLQRCCDCQKEINWSRLTLILQAYKENKVDIFVLCPGESVIHETGAVHEVITVFGQSESKSNPFQLCMSFGYSMTTLSRLHQYFSSVKREMRYQNNDGTLMKTKHMKQFVTAAVGNIKPAKKRKDVIEEILKVLDIEKKEDKLKQDIIEKGNVTKRKKNKRNAKGQFQSKRQKVS